ncbi:MAG: hypothetical protein ABSB65_09935 [Candidatus Acidiferrales bacterium]|jgi:hypothetical protein
MRKDLKVIRCFCVMLVLAGTLGTGPVRAQESTEAREQPVEVARRWKLLNVSMFGQDPQQSSTTQNGKPPSPNATPPQTKPTDQNNADTDYGKQPKRILGIIPNYRAVSANTYLPPMTFKTKFWLATQETFDYSNFLLVGAIAGIALAQNSQPTFGHGASGYGQYYWHNFVDGGIENYMTEAIFPTLTKEDPRYYTMGKGPFLKRTGYAISRLVITRTDSGGSTFNISEIAGAGAAAGIGNTYYPAEHNPWVKTYQRWGTQVGLDGIFNVLKEFWPDIDKAVFHGKY